MSFARWMRSTNTEYGSQNSERCGRGAGQMMGSTVVIVGDTGDSVKKNTDSGAPSGSLSSPGRRRSSEGGV